MAVPASQRFWGSVEPVADGLLVRLDEDEKVPLVLRDRISGRGRTFAGGQALLRLEDRFGEGVWDVHVEDSRGRSMRVQASWLGPDADRAAVAAGRLLAIVPFRTVLGGLSLRTYDRAEHLELRAWDTDDQDLILTGRLTTAEEHPELAHVALRGLAGITGQDATVQLRMRAQPDGSSELRIPLRELRLAQKAAVSAFEPLLETDEGHRIDIGMLLGSERRRRRLEAGVAVVVEDPDLDSGLVDESPEPSVLIRTTLDRDGSARIRVSTEPGGPR